MAFILLKVFRLFIGQRENNEGSRDRENVNAGEFLNEDNDNRDALRTVLGEERRDSENEEPMLTNEWIEGDDLLDVSTNVEKNNVLLATVETDVIDDDDKMAKDTDIQSDDGQESIDLDVENNDDQVATVANEEKYENKVETVSYAQVNDERVAISDEEGNDDKVVTVSDKGDDYKVETVSDEEGNDDKVRKVSDEEGNDDQVVTVSGEEGDDDKVRTVSDEEGNDDKVVTVSDEGDDDKVETVSDEEGNDDKVVTVSVEGDDYKVATISDEEGNDERVTTVTDEEGNDDQVGTVSDEGGDEKLTILDEEGNDDQVVTVSGKEGNDDQVVTVLDEEGNDDMVAIVLDVERNDDQVGAVKTVENEDNVIETSEDSQQCENNSITDKTCNDSQGLFEENIESWQGNQIPDQFDENQSGNSGDSESEMWPKYGKKIDEIHNIVKRLQKTPGALLASDEGGFAPEGCRNQTESGVTQKMGHTILIAGNTITGPGNDQPTSSSTSSNDRVNNSDGGLSLNLTICPNANTSQNITPSPYNGSVPVVGSESEVRSGPLYNQQAINQVIISPVSDSVDKRTSFKDEDSDHETSSKHQVILSPPASPVSDSVDKRTSSKDKDSDNDTSDDELDAYLSFDEKDNDSSFSLPSREQGKDAIVKSILDCTVVCLGARLAAEKRTSDRIIGIIDTSHSMKTTLKLTNKDGHAVEVTSLEVVQSAMKEIVEKIPFQPKRKIGFMTFDDNIVIHCKEKSFSVETDPGNKEYLQLVGEQLDAEQWFSTDIENLTDIIHSVKPEEDSNSVKLEADSNMVKQEEDSHMVKLEAYSNMVKQEEDSHMVKLEADSNMVKQEKDLYMVKPDADSNMVTSEEDSNMVTSEEDSNMVTSEEDSNMVTSEEDSNMVTSEEDLNMVKPKDDSNILSAIRVALGIKQGASGSVILVFTDRVRQRLIAAMQKHGEDVLNEIDKLANAKQQTVAIISFEQSPLTEMDKLEEEKAQLTPKIGILTHLIEKIKAVMIPGNTERRSLTVQQNTYAQLLMETTKVIVGEDYLETVLIKQRVEDLPSAFCLEFENTPKSPETLGQVKFRLNWRLFVYEAAENPLRNVIQKLEKAIEDLASHGEKFGDLSETARKDLYSSLNIHDTVRELLDELKRLLGLLDGHNNDIGTSITRMWKTNEIVFNDFKESFGTLIVKIENSVQTIESKIDAMGIHSSEGLEENNRKFAFELSNLYKAVEDFRNSVLTLFETLNEKDERFEKTEKRLRKTEMKLRETEQKLEGKLEKLEQLMMYSLSENSSAQQSSFMNFGSYFILEVEDGTITTNTIKIDISKITEKPKLTLTHFYSNKCGNDKCQAFFSHIDICENASRGYSWTCKFCQTKRLLDRIQLFSPSDNDICYIETQGADPCVMEDYKIVFVIDISGSMVQQCQNTLTRLEAVKKAVSAKIQHLMKTTPKRKIGLAIFNNVVKIYGSSRNSTIGNNLDNMDYLLNEGRSNSEIKVIEQNGNNLIRTINGLTPDGGTALGPALLLALGMLKNTRGSRIIVCTDGGSNVGIGALYREDPNPQGGLFSFALGMLQNNISSNSGFSPMDPREIAVFYQTVTDLAKSQAVTISINSFDDCELSVLELLARETGGNVRRISPTDLHIHMDEDISRDIVATNTTVKVVVPTELYVHPSGQADKTKSSASFTVGNVADNNNHIICFEFGCRPGFRVNQGWQRTASGNYYLPFQVQLTYQDKNGRKLTRVVSMLRELTRQQKFAKLCMNAETVVTSLVQKAAKHLLESRQDSRRTSALADDFFRQAREHRNIDKIKFKPELTFKLDMFILVLEKISAVGLHDEMSELLSQMAKMA